ncbi:sensor histidine kinase [Rossellomorea sp. NS-SX7]|uniref:sensor histidine kinase n=1 Tax=Rossellomorea sp. NS-SX7 TaxID=3463856 RepID=UPI00405966CA
MKSLYVKFVLSTIGIMVISGILAFLLSNAYYQQKLKPYNDQKNTTIALKIADYANEHPEIDLEEYLDNISGIGYQLLLVGNSGNDTFFGSTFNDPSLPETVREHVLNGKIYHGILQFPRKTFVTGFFANEVENSIGVPLTHDGNKYALFLRPDIKLLFNEMHYLFGWLLVLTILLSILFVIFGTKYLVKPISTLTKATKSLSKGQFNVEGIDLNRSDELGVLSRSFSQMTRKLEQMEDMRREFISNISHDIQSPLSNIKGYTGLLESESIKPEDKKEYIAIINGEINRLSSLTKQLLLLASLDRNEEMMKVQSFNVGKQLKELIRNYQWKVNERGIMIGYSLPDTEFKGDPALLLTVWENLLTNAIKYNKPNGSIDITMEKKEHTLSVLFEDTGIGMNSGETERIFDRFYRVDTARSRSIEGSGLGLSIVSTIVSLHGGQITVKSKERDGTAFIVELPLPPV